MSDRVVELIRTLGSGDLESRLQEAATRSGTAPLESEDVLHLVRILTSSSLVATSITDLIQLNDLIEAHVHPGTLRLLSESASDEAALKRLFAVPDHVRGLGDKCLFETGVAQRRGPDGLDFSDLGRRSYARAAHILQVLSEDRRLQDFYAANQLHSLSLEREIGFLQRCSERFNAHVRLLRRLLEDDRPTLLPGRVAASDPSPTDDLAPRHDEADPKAAALATRTDELAPTTPHHADEEADESEERRQRVAELHLVSRSDEENEEIRFRELMVAEKTVLFSALDTELLRRELKRVVIHQEGAIDSLCDELTLYSTGTQDPRKPASYFLLGPTGVGKNYLVESMLRLFERLWGIEVPYLELEGPEFTYPSDINELKGAARGFIRSDEEGVMTQFHRRAHDKPFSVILVDEVEKAHPQLRRFFLPIMDRGTMMDNRGKVLHFENTMIFFTSNIGYSDASRKTQTIGYGDERSEELAARRFVDRSIRKTLSPEFINRVHLIHFEHLTRAAVDEIFDLEIAKIRDRYAAAQGIELVVTEAARGELLGRGYSHDYGARNLGKVLGRWANIEVAKVIKQDQHGRLRDVMPALSLIRDMRSGKRPYEASEVQSAVDGCSRISVPYERITIDFDGSEFTYEQS